MSDHNGARKPRGLRSYAASAIHAVTLLVGTLIVIGIDKAELRGTAAQELAAWGIPVTGEATSLVIVALVGVVLIARRHESL